MLKRATVCLLLVSGLVWSGPVLGVTHPASGIVEWVIDGDTFVITGGEKVRLIGVDAPEYNPNHGKVQLYGKEAFQFARKLLKEKLVTLEYDVKKEDDYGRNLAYVFLKDGRFVNLVMVSEGLARAKYYKPNGKYYLQLKQAEAEAKRQKKGIWADKEAAPRLANSVQSV